MCIYQIYQLFAEESEVLYMYIQFNDFILISNSYQFYKFSITLDLKLQLEIQ